MKSMCVLSYKQEHAGAPGSLETVVSDHNSNWMTAVEALDGERFIGAESDKNIFVLSKSQNPSTPEQAPDPDLDHSV